MPDIRFLPDQNGPALTGMVAVVADAIMDAQTQWERENSRDRPGVQYPWTTPHVALLARAAILAMVEPDAAMLSAVRVEDRAAVIRSHCAMLLSALDMEVWPG